MKAVVKIDPLTCDIVKYYNGVKECIQIEGRGVEECVTDKSPYHLGYIYMHYEKFECIDIDELQEYIDKRYKIICQLDLDGNLVKMWRSQQDAARELNINKAHICECVNGKLQRAGSFQ